MKKIFYAINNEHFVAHVEQDEYFNFIVKGEVYPIQKYTTVGENVEKWGYVKLYDNNIHENDTPDNTCKKMFDFSFRWRGVWEGKIYFKDEEYWSDEIKIISALWEKIEIDLKKIIE